MIKIIKLSNGTSYLSEYIKFDGCNCVHNILKADVTFININVIWYSVPLTLLKSLQTNN